MQATLRMLAGSRKRGGGGAIRFRANWTTPGLSSHQMLDAGVAARQHASRKALKKSKRPFDNYFKVEFRRSQSFRLPRIQRNGILAARDAARLMTNPRENWRTPWDGTMWRLAKARTDVLEAVAPAFGDDPLDKVVDQLLDIRFEWDREDDVVAPSLVPESLYTLTAHCAPYATSPLGTQGSSSSPSHAMTPTDHSTTGADDEEGETVFLPDGTTMIMPSRRRKHAYRRVKNAGGHPKRVYRKPNLGFNGVDTVPSLVADAVRGPLMSSSSEPALSWRWKAASRRAESVAQMLQLRRRVSTVVAVGLTPRVALLLLKAAASEELEDPALEVSLGVAMGENFGGYTTAECLEVLRSLRRLALVRSLPALVASTSSATPEGSSSTSHSDTDARLYHDGCALPRAFHAYVEDVAPFLVDKVWSRVPELSRHLLHDQLYLDWFDLISLAVEVGGSAHLPENLPNPSSHAPYAAKYLFFRYTLGLDETMMGDVLECLKASALAVAASHRGGGGAHLPVGLYVDDEKELVGRPRILWLVVALLVRVVAEAVGDVLRHVQRSLHEHAELAAEGLGAAPNPTVEMNQFLDRIALARPRVVEPYRASVAGSRARRGGLRVRLLPFEAFPHVTQLRPAPFHRTAKGTVGQRGASAPRTRSRPATPAALTNVPTAGGDTLLESSFASVFAASPRLVKHVERATAALEWAAAILRACRGVVGPLTQRTPQPAPLEMAELPATSVAVAGEDGSVVQRRQALCRAHVQSRVEAQLDALFTFVPWTDLLDGNGLQPPWLAVLDPTPAASSEDAVDAKAEAGEPEASEEANLLAMMLADDTDTPCTEEESARETPSIVYSEAEVAMRAAMEGLNDALGLFEVAVADVLESYENFFDIPRRDHTEALPSAIGSE